MKGNNFVKFKFHYTLSPKIPYVEILDVIPNVEFVTDDNYLTGFDVTLQKALEPKQAQIESDEYAYLLSDLISIKSHRYTIPNLSGTEFVDVIGNTHVQGSLILKWDVEGAPAKLDAIGRYDLFCRTVFFSFIGGDILYGRVGCK